MSPVKFPKSEKYDFGKSLVKHHKLVPHLDRYLGTEVEEFNFTYEPKSLDDAWHPSGHCIPSVTELYKLVTEPQEKKEWGTAMLKTFMVGHFWHQLLQKVVVDIGFAEPDAIERRGIRRWGDTVPDIGMTWPAYHWATGAGDVAPCSIPNHGDYVIDFKTMSAHQYKGNGVPDWAANKYEAQINIYMDFFDIDKALIVPICKDTPHDFKEFEYERNQKLIDTIYGKWKFVSECLDEGISPDKECNEIFSLDGLFKGPIAQ